MEIHSKIQEITAKIQQEGLDKANQESDKIIREAKSSAKEIVAKAQEEADKIREEAKRNAEEMKERMQSEVRMSQQQAIAHPRYG